MSITLPPLPCPPLPKLACRELHSHKGNFGHALLIGGSRGMSGAISLSGLAALHSGAGLVTLAVPDRCLETVAGFNPCAMTIPLPDGDDGKLAKDALALIEGWYERATCIALGPGLGVSPALQYLVQQIFVEAPCPTLIDADGLNNLAENKSWQRGHRGPRILTPHPGEWARLCGCGASDLAGQRMAAVSAASEFDLIIALKGHNTLVTDGKSLVLNTTGTPAMATAGSGDVLTGVIAAMICQGLSPRDAVHFAVHMHGLAGETAQRQLRSRVVIATELIARLSTVIQEN